MRRKSVYSVHICTPSAAFVWQVFHFLRSHVFILPTVCLWETRFHRSNTPALSNRKLHTPNLMETVINLSRSKTFRSTIVSNHVDIMLKTRCESMSRSTVRASAFAKSTPFG
ncbi:hypothetical protein PAXRUDRAFT_347333 [Paxillus rubicundulus Ve08.2h10]|uniref:Uncharacterized protein n=1 Tax=Paxillus rubicundulus Ve08.2h10 TaxID=930991 RepID=A0A0D0DEJ3_9AGAM|nr:hypothetical protein PAXRUDRAFT_347333 [Paxillus rubicundulus Ve08.2h10]